jgi:hypothetical protein
MRRAPKRALLERLARSSVLDVRELGLLDARRFDAVLADLRTSGMLARLTTLTVGHDREPQNVLTRHTELPATLRCLRVGNEVSYHELHREGRRLRGVAHGWAVNGVLMAFPEEIDELVLDPAGLVEEEDLRRLVTAIRHQRPRWKVLNAS